MSCGVNGVLAALRSAAEAVAESHAELTELDRAIGDADHGENMRRGFQAVALTLETADSSETPGQLLKRVASTLISTVGGASGPLYGTAFLRAAAASGDRAEWSSAELAEVLGAALDGVVARGRAETGDKTMVDALTPAVAAARESASGGASPREVVRAAAEAAHDGAEATAPLTARKGRASYLGDRSVGHVDPGARSTALLLAAFADSKVDSR